MPVATNRWPERQSPRRMFMLIWVGYQLGWAALIFAVILFASATSHHAFTLPPLWVFALNMVYAAAFAAWMTRLIRRGVRERAESQAERQ
jgi:drug/metabolite transporter (DMT)-like permease